MVALAGPHAQHHHRPLSHSAMERASRDEWRADIDNARSLLWKLFLRQRGEPIVPGEVSFEGERAEAFERLNNDTNVKTAALVKDHWSAIERVAKALRAGRLLSQADLDALIAGDHA